MWLAWGVFFGLVVGMVALSVFLVLLYSRKKNSLIGGRASDPTEERSGAFLPLLISGLSLFVVFCCACLIPIDIFIVSSSSDPKTGERVITDDQLSHRETIVQVLYYTLYTCVLILTLCAVPFAHFYYEETGPNACSRAVSASKYAIIMLVILVVMFVIGLLLSGSVPDLNLQDSSSVGSVEDYVNTLIKSTSWFEQSMDFVMAIFTLLGFSIFCTYTALGLSSLPVTLIRGKKHIDEERIEVSDELEDVQDQQTKIKATRKHGKMNEEDLETLLELEERERSLSRHRDGLEESSSIDCQRCCIVLRPFFVLFGGLFAIFSVALVACIVASTFERLVTSGSCGFACGFVDIDGTSFINPLDMGLILASKFFPLDIVLLAIVISYLVGASLFSLSSAGIKLLYLSLYKVGVRSTSPQGMLWLAMYLVLSLTAINFELMFLAPQYTTWGSQTYNDNGEVVRCSMDGGAIKGDTHVVTSTCTMSRLGIMYNMIQMRLPFFGVAFTFVNLGFLVAWLIGLIYSICKGRDANFQEEDDEDLFDDMIDDDDL